MVSPNDIASSAKVDNKLKNIITSTPFRLGVLFTVLYLFCFSVGGAVFYKKMQSRVNVQIDSILAQRYDRIIQLYETKGIERAIQTVRGVQSDSPIQLGMAYQIMNAAGEIVVGKIEGSRREFGYYNLSSDQLGIDQSNKNFRMYTGSLGDHTLTLGVNLDLRDDLQRKFISSISLTFVLASIFALLGAMVLARNYNYRFNHLAQFMKGVGKGNLQRRLPVSGRGDGIDRLSGDINNAVTLLQKQVDGMKQVSENIAHDLKTPLSHLSIKIEDALCEVTPGDPLYHKLEAASENATEINKTFEKLLHIAQIQAGARKSKFVDMDLIPMLSNVFDVFQVMAEEKNQKLFFQVDHDEIWLSGDNDLLCQLVVNLLENAIHHCASGSEIVLSTGLEGDQPWVSVSDNGEGVPDSETAQVFDALYRLEKSRTSKGSGLGLTLVKAIADLHGGEVTLSSNSPGLCARILFWKITKAT